MQHKPQAWESDSLEPIDRDFPPQYRSPLSNDEGFVLHGQRREVQGDGIKRANGIRWWVRGPVYLYECFWTWTPGQEARGFYSVFRVSDFSDEESIRRVPIVARALHRHVVGAVKDGDEAAP